jgi:hypothetical protein
MAIIVSCRWLSAFFNVGVALIASSDAQCGRSIALATTSAEALSI